MSRIAVVDLGTGNLHSVSKALERVAPPGRAVQITSNPEAIRAAGHVVLPGQGAIGTWFRTLGEEDLRRAVEDALQTQPVLGICLGLQALYSFSEENEGMKGFGLLAGSVRRFPDAHQENGSPLKVPHMGWNNVKPKPGHPLFVDLEADAKFYFLHSYYFECDEQSNITANVFYGFDFTCSVSSGNVHGVQFHPEKSHHFGAQFLKNFAEL